MIAEVKIALTCMNIGTALGILLALLLPKFEPRWRRRWLNTRSWTICLLASVVCTAMSVGHFVQGRPYLGGFFVTFGTLALFVSLVCAIRFLARSET